MKAHPTLLLLAVACSLLLGSATLAGDACGARALGGGVSGSVDIGVDRVGRVVIVVDEIDTRTDRPDGLIDHIFTFSPREPYGQAFSYHAEKANITFAPDRVTVTAPDRSVLVDVAIKGEPRNYFKTPPKNALVLLEGIELIHRRVDSAMRLDSFDSRETFEGFYRSTGPIEIAPNAPATGEILNPVKPQECQSGGEGATQCSCSGADGCSVTCGSGYHACCNCQTVTLPTCKCAAN